jgi:hypothetical protein
VGICINAHHRQFSPVTFVARILLCDIREKI